MSRRPASCLTAPLVASLAALTLAGCSGGKDAPAPPPVVEAKPAESVSPPAAEAKPAEPASSAAAQQQPAPSPQETPPTDAQPPDAAPAPDPNPKPADKTPDALQWLQDGEARRVDHERRVKEAEANLAIANASVADWERTLLAFKNPFMARPKLSPDDAQMIEGLDGQGRVAWAEGRLAAARSARDAAQKTLADLKANPPVS